MTKNNCKISLKTSTLGATKIENYSGVISKTSNLTYITYNELYEGNPIKTTFSILTDNSIKVSKSGDYSYSFLLKENVETDFLLNYQSFSVSYKVKTSKIIIKESQNSIKIIVKYQMISGSEVTKNIIELQVALGESLC